jgi:GH24 family phage-related lysozyme (muramidase)
MRAAVRPAFTAHVERYEGRTTWMYLDTKGLVTVGVGNLVDPVSLALELPWLRGEGGPASCAEVEAEWERVKAMREGMVAGRYRTGAGLHLAEEAVDELVARKLEEFWGHLVRYFPGAPDWPADAQLGLLLHAWAVGPHAYRRAKGWPKLSAALDSRDWAMAAEECVIPGARASRNEAHQRCFTNAAAGADPEVLFYPEAVV